jgi:hypothetical protein
MAKKYDDVDGVIFQRLYLSDWSDYELIVGFLRDTNRTRANSVTKVERKTPGMEGVFPILAVVGLSNTLIYDFPCSISVLDCLDNLQFLTKMSKLIIPVLDINYRLNASSVNMQKRQVEQSLYAAEKHNLRVLILIVFDGRLLDLDVLLPEFDADKVEVRVVFKMDLNLIRAIITDFLSKP